MVIEKDIISDILVRHIPALEELNSFKYSGLEHQYLLLLYVI